jgi:hypothetical protein
VSDDRIYTVQPSIYRGTVFRSRLEAECAKMLDALGLGWVYEPRRFELRGGVSYLPDFWVDDLCLWIECRGYDSEKGRRQIQRFCERLYFGGSEAHGPRSAGAPPRPQWKNADFLLLRPDSAAVLWDGDDGCREDPTGLVGAFRHDVEGSEAQCWLCVACGKGFFLTLEGSYACRACGEYARWRQHLPFRENDPDVAVLRLGQPWRQMLVSHEAWATERERRLRAWKAAWDASLASRCSDQRQFSDIQRVVQNAVRRGEYGPEVQRAFREFEEMSSR